MEQKNSDIFVIAAPSGTGKTTITHRLVKELTDIDISVSVTTRPKRQGEVNGVHYWFVGVEEFNQKIRDGKFIEWAEVFGNFYGTTYDEVERIRKKGHRILLEIDVQGWDNIKKALPHAHSVFILPPSLQILWKRLTGRGTDSLQVQWKRLTTARKELHSAASFEHFVINDDLEKSYAEVKNLVKNGIPVKLSKADGISHSQSLLVEFETSQWLNDIQDKLG